MGLFRRRKQAAPALVADPCLYDPAAARLRAAMQARNWPQVRDFLAQVADPDDRAFYVDVCADVPGVQDWIEEWIRAEPHSTLPLLVRGAHGVHWAWEARGAASASQTSEEQFREFFKRLKMAENCLDEVVERDPGDVVAWSYLVTSARGRQVDRDEAERRFRGVVDSCPWHRRTHEQMLQYVCRKWFGSHEEMFAFARDTVAKMPDGSVLGELIAVAHIEMWLDLPSGEDEEYMRRPEVMAEINAAADRSVRHPAYRPRPGWPPVHNTFAMAFCLGGDLGSAAQQFQLLGDRVTDWPWQYLRSDAAGVYQAWRAKVLG
ncbi:DUF4034 domain-containing protein [Thermomonospora amylolytica]|uniref:DUF4034 domain-containing protein n=1 Tax=Thermomonospora amylolytica TaxID=1411117 RepID=UPI000E6C6B13|nr:DUF4034 domain-containing protein [Thermomonospora amylolytica]